MKTFSYLFLATLLVINNLFAQEPQESPELKEASALMQSAVKRFEEQKYDEALIQAKKALEIREKLLPRSDPQPEYPAAARDRRLAGTVIVKVEIDETGKVISAYDMCQGPPFLSESAVKSARQALFTPTKLSGVPIRVKGVIQYNFVRR